MPNEYTIHLGERDILIASGIPTILNHGYTDGFGYTGDIYEYTVEDIDVVSVTLNGMTIPARDMDEWLYDSLLECAEEWFEYNLESVFECDS
jgi:hypothetical protein